MFWSRFYVSRCSTMCDENKMLMKPTVKLVSICVYFHCAICVGAGVTVVLSLLNSRLTLIPHFENQSNLCALVF